MPTTLGTLEALLDRKNKTFVKFKFSVRGTNDDNDRLFGKTNELLQLKTLGRKHELTNEFTNEFSVIPSICI